MLPWQIEVVKAAALALVAFGGGYGTYWLKYREKEQGDCVHKSFGGNEIKIRSAEKPTETTVQITVNCLSARICTTQSPWEKEKDAALRERQRQAEFEEFKNKRRLVGSGEVERMERADKLTDILIKQKQHGITAQELEQAKELVMGKRRKRSKAETIDPPTEEVGLNGGKIGYLPNGDKVEWIVDDEDEEPFPMLLRRNDNDILAAYNEFWDKVWWNRHRSFELRDGADKTNPNWLKGDEAAKKIEEKYGIENLLMSDFEFGVLSGKMSALSWVMGSEWEGSMDT
jgi:hypothetical protein